MQLKINMNENGFSRLNLMLDSFQIHISSIIHSKIKAITYLLNLFNVRFHLLMKNMDPKDA